MEVSDMAPENAKQSYAIKKNTKRQAWEFGAGSDMEQKMISSERIIRHPNGLYEVFSKEATEGKGQMAHTGDYFKVDEEGFPSPCERDWFQKNHEHLEADWYLQKAKPLKIWRKGDGESEEIKFLIDNGALTINEEEARNVRQMFDYAFANYSSQEVVVGNQTILEKKSKVIGGKVEEVCICPSRSSYVFGKRGEKKNVTLEYEFSGIKAPFEKGEKVGRVTIYEDNVAVDCVDLLTAEGVEKANLYDTLKKISNAWNLK